MTSLTQVWWVLAIIWRSLSSFQTQGDWNRGFSTAFPYNHRTPESCAMSYGGHSGHPTLSDVQISFPLVHPPIQSSSIIINHHQSSSIIINHHQSSSIIINHHQSINHPYINLYITNHQYTSICTYLHLIKKKESSGNIVVVEPSGQRPSPWRRSWSCAGSPRGWWLPARTPWSRSARDPGDNTKADTCWRSPWWGTLGPSLLEHQSSSTRKQFNTPMRTPPVRIFEVWVANMLLRPQVSQENEVNYDLHGCKWGMEFTMFYHILNSIGRRLQPQNGW